MSKGRDTKVFTAQLQRMRLDAQRAGKPLAAEPAFPSGQQIDMAQVVAAIEGLRKEVRDVVRILLPEELEEVKQAVVAAERLEHEKAEVNLLRTELRALANSIQQTKSEIAALRPADSDEDRLVAVTHELDAIVSATEKATQNILDAAERIDHLAANVRSHEKDSFVQGLVDEMREQIITIFEACNFQDITGQRITKVVNTLKYVEERINAMIDIWGEESFRDLAGKKATPDEEDWEKQLLNGPQLENKGISQDEIDKLFG